MLRQILTATTALTALAAMSAPANAVVTTFDLTTGDSPFDYEDGLGHDEVFGAKGGPNLTARGWYDDALENYVAVDGEGKGLTRGTNGLGLRGPAQDDNFGFPPETDQLDEVDGRELISFQFGSDEWTPVSMTLTYFHNDEAEDEDEDPLFLVSTSPDGTPGGAWMELTPGDYSSESVDPVSGSVPTETWKFTFDGITDPFQSLYVTGANNDVDDSFRIAEVQGEQQLPEPGAIAVLGLGLVGLGLARVRRRA